MDLLSKTGKPPTDSVPWEAMEDSLSPKIIRNVLFRGAWTLRGSSMEVISLGQGGWEEILFQNWDFLEPW